MVKCKKDADDELVQIVFPSLKKLMSLNMSQAKSDCDQYVIYLDFTH